MVSSKTHSFFNRLLCSISFAAFCASDSLYLTSIAPEPTTAARNTSFTVTAAISRAINKSNSAVTCVCLPRFGCCCCCCYYQKRTHTHTHLASIFLQLCNSIHRWNRATVWSNKHVHSHTRTHAQKRDKKGRNKQNNHIQSRGGSI
uniref:Putative secreted protein n=1 Tax=Anopheles marajoara TaxID=58244 RepID=A0A2M4C6G3_9DIPT